MRLCPMARCLWLPVIGSGDRTTHLGKRHGLSRESVLGERDKSAADSTLGKKPRRRVIRQEHDMEQTQSVSAETLGTLVVRRRPHLSDDSPPQSGPLRDLGRGP